MSEPYRGYANYQTWMVAIWLKESKVSGEDFSLHEMVEEWSEEEPDPGKLADRIQELVEEQRPPMEPKGLYARLLDHMFDEEVDWDSIADDFFEDEVDEEATA